ncbi:hypothetical protein QAD02_000942 [Eretmocerus hayati]|uniref:Uncharacterized protein n=1 Tax=Eretmocerus hayati TaxID=131215 RepID=A0ACC2NEU5_9HYME|nr:hypothetical protein QAD02_000942 [Eretmocerus hayati]
MSSQSSAWPPSLGQTSPPEAISQVRSPSGSVSSRQTNRVGGGIALSPSLIECSPNQTGLAADGLLSKVPAVAERSMERRSRVTFKGESSAISKFTGTSGALTVDPDGRGFGKSQ